MDFSNPFAFDTGEQQFPITSPTWPMTSSEDPLASVMTSSSSVTSTSRRSRYQSHPGAVREETEQEETDSGGSRTRKLSQRQLSQVLGTKS